MKVVLSICTCHIGGLINVKHGHRSPHLVLMWSLELTEKSCLPNPVPFLRGLASVTGAAGMRHKSLYFPRVAVSSWFPP